MRKLFSVFAIAALGLVLGACDKKEETKTEGTTEKAGKVEAPAAEAPKIAEAPKPPPPPPPPPPAAKVDMKDMKVTAAVGWEGEYNAALESWTFEKYTPAGDGTNEPNRFYVQKRSDEPTEVEAFAGKLQADDNFLNMGYKYIKVDKKEAVDGGWLILGVEKDMGDEEDKGNPGFVMKRDAQDILCHGSVFRTDALRTEAVEACKSINF